VSKQGAEPAGGGEHDRSDSFEATHAAIIARTLRWADEAAARREYAEAVRWVETVQSLGEALPDEYEARRRAWQARAGRRARS
jgi:hypothetical protein